MGRWSRKPRRPTTVWDVLLLVLGLVLSAPFVVGVDRWLTAHPGSRDGPGGLLCYLCACIPGFLIAGVIVAGLKERLSSLGAGLLLVVGLVAACLLGKAFDTRRPPGAARPGPASPGPASPGPASPGPASPGPATPPEGLRARAEGLFQHAIRRRGEWATVTRDGKKPLTFDAVRLTRGGRSYWRFTTTGGFVDYTVDVGDLPRGEGAAAEPDVDFYRPGEAPPPDPPGAAAPEAPEAPETTTAPPAPPAAAVDPEQARARAAPLFEAALRRRGLLDAVTRRGTQPLTYEAARIVRRGRPGWRFTTQGGTVDYAADVPDAPRPGEPEVEVFLAAAAPPPDPPDPPAPPAPPPGPAGDRARAVDDATRAADR